MQIKIKLFDRNTEMEIDDKEVVTRLMSKVRQILQEEFDEFDFYVKAYGEISRIGR